jgi:hypothetical protein
MHQSLIPIVIFSQKNFFLLLLIGVVVGSSLEMPRPPKSKNIYTFVEK